MATDIKNANVYATVFHHSTQRMVTRRVISDGGKFSNTACGYLPDPNIVNGKPVEYCVRYAQI